MKNCDRCDTTLAPGSAHLDADACIAALRHELEAARRCPACGKPAEDCEGGKLACPPCASAAFARKKAGAGLLWAGQRIVERLMASDNQPPPQSGGKRASNQ
jgi:hypothetical protein